MTELRKRGTCKTQRGQYSPKEFQNIFPELKRTSLQINVNQEASVKFQNNEKKKNLEIFRQTSRPREQTIKRPSETFQGDKESQMQGKEKDMGEEEIREEEGGRETVRETWGGKGQGGEEREKGHQSWGERERNRKGRSKT